MPRAILILEIFTLFATLAEPKRFVLADSHHTEPRVTRLVISKSEDDIHLLERSERSLGVEEVDDGDDGKICCSEYDPGAVADVVECDWCDENDTVRQSV